MLHKLLAPACAFAALSISSTALAAEDPTSESADVAESATADGEVESVAQVESSAPLTLGNEVAAAAGTSVERLTHGGRLSIGAARTLAGMNGINVRYYISDHFHLGLNLGVTTFSYREPDLVNDAVDCGNNQQSDNCTKTTRTVAYIGTSLEGVYWVLGKPAGNWPFQADFGIGGRLGFQHIVNDTDIPLDLDDPLQFTVEIPLIMQLNLGENFSIAPEFGAVIRWNPGTRLSGDVTEMPPDPGDSNPGFGATAGPGFGFAITDHVGVFGGASLNYAF